MGCVGNPYTQAIGGRSGGAVIRLFKHYVPHTVLLLGLIDFVLLMLSAEGGWLLREWQIGGGLDPEVSRLPNILAFAVSLELAMVGVGVYALDALRSMRFAVARLIVAISLGALLLSVIFFVAPWVTFWRSNLLYAMLIALLLLTGARILLGRTLDGEAFKGRILVLGAGPRAARLEALAGREGAGFTIAG